jgi:transglutaminase/protease-like cytokinesis protein 3
MARTLIIILPILLAFGSVHSQRTQLLEFDYSFADSIAVNFPKGRYDDAKAFAKLLCEDVNTEHEKFRVIFRWITENVEYRYGRQGTDADEILKKKKAVCEGYASLLEAMCHEVDIKCETVIGFAKSNPNTDIPNKLKETNHAWNAVFLAGEWILVDATWAAGTVDPKRRKFKQGFQPQWFLADPNFFIHTHYPESERWLLNDTPIKKKEFKKGPIPSKSGYDMGVELLSKKKGVVGKKMKIEFNSTSDIQWASIKFINEKEPIGILLVKHGTHFKIRHEFEKNQKGGFYLFLDGSPALSFRKKE